MDVYAYPHLGYAGRLGNQLWEVAATIAMATRTPGSRPSIPANWEYRPYVSLPESFYYRPKPDDRVIDAANEPGGPYFQELEYIAEVAPMLKAWFSPSEFGLGRLHDRHERLLDDMILGRHYTAIHVRRGDYVQYSDRFPLMTPKYWWEAARQVRDEVPHTTFLVFSDDIPWCRENAEYAFGPASQNMEFIEGHVRPIPPAFRTSEPADIFDLWLMTHCRAHIIANSTFSWWGAYLADEWNVYYPDKWFGDPSLFDRMWNCIPAEWRQLPC